MMDNFFLFMLFSTFEGLAVYALSFYIFRMNLRKYLWHSLLIIEILNLQNYLAREEIVHGAAVLAPLINIIVSMLFFRTIVKVPIIWSMLMTVTGYIIYALLQTILIFALFQSVSAAQDDPVKGYIIQFLSAAITISLGSFFYKKGYGFTYDFEKIKLKRERFLVVFLIAVFIVTLAFMMFYQNLFVNFFGFLVSLTIFLFYSLRRESEHGI